MLYLPVVAVEARDVGPGSIKRLTEHVECARSVGSVV
jgi:hypothetical protein